MDIQKVPLKKAKDDSDSESGSDNEETLNLHLDLAEDKKKVKGDVPLIPQDDEESETADDEEDDGSSKKESVVEVDEDEEMIREFGEQPKDDSNPATSDRRGSTGGSVAAATGSVTSESKKKKHLSTMDEDVMTPEEKKQARQEDLLWWFSRLKKNKHKLPKIEIPDVSELDDVDTLQRYKNRIVKHIKSDQSIINWRKILTFAFCGIEFAATEWGGLDMKGYSETQIENIEQYDDILIELGEGSVLEWFEGWPAWARLLLLVLWNTAIFVVVKFASKKIGMSEKTIRGFFKNFTGGKQDKDPEPDEEEEELKPGSGAAASGGPISGKLKGPSIKIRKD
jgi:hypothetical protein